MARIVIADDSPTLRRIVSSVLTKHGHEVVQAEDGIGAVQAVFAHQPDAVVLDVQMPRVSGFIAVRVLKDDWQTADIPVVMLTSLDAASDRYWADQSGVDHYLTKDFAAGELTDAIDGVLAAAATARGGRPAMRPDPVELSESDVLARVCDLLDRKLFESSVAQSVTAIAPRRAGWRPPSPPCSACCSASSATTWPRCCWPRSARRTSRWARTPSARTTTPSWPPLPRRSRRTAGRRLTAGAVDPGGAGRGTLVPAAEDLPRLRVGRDVDVPVHAAARSRRDGGGRLALSSATRNAFGETALSTLKLLEGPSAIVIDNARLSASR
jgi:twitching motility two-component system response regulator PilH